MKDHTQCPEITRLPCKRGKIKVPVSGLIIHFGGQPQTQTMCMILLIKKKIKTILKVAIFYT